MKIALKYPNNVVEMDKYRYFSGKRFQWFDWTNTKRAADTTAKRIRASGSKARVVPMVGGYAIYTKA